MNGHDVCLTVRVVIINLVAVASRALARLGPIWADRVTILTYKGFMVRLCNGVTVNGRRKGFWFDLNLGDNLQRCLFFSGTYEDAYLRFLEREVRPGDTYIDVGGHIGLDAFIVARALEGRGRVVCFEPSPDSAVLIHSGAAANGLSDLVEVVECGLANEEGRLLLRADPRYPIDDSGVRSRYNDGPVVVNARLRRFDDWATEESLDRIDIVKLDVEGCEYDVLLGMRDSLIKFQPRAIVVEVNDSVEKAGVPASKIDEFLANCGYGRSGVVYLENVLYRIARHPLFCSKWSNLVSL